MDHVTGGARAPRLPRHTKAGGAYCVARLYVHARYDEVKVQMQGVDARAPNADGCVRTPGLIVRRALSVIAWSTSVALNSVGGRDISASGAVMPAEVEPSRENPSDCGAGSVCAADIAQTFARGVSGGGAVRCTNDRRRDLHVPCASDGAQYERDVLHHRLCPSERGGGSMLIFVLSPPSSLLLRRSVGAPDLLFTYLGSYYFCWPTGCLKERLHPILRVYYSFRLSSVSFLNRDD